MSQKTPEYEAYRFMERIRVRDGGKWSDYEDQYPEQIRLGKIYKSAAYKKWKERSKADRRASYAHLENVSWFDILDDYAKYKRLRQQGKLTEDHEALREVYRYYNMLMQKDLPKRRQHPDIAPMSLGNDPRKREWPSGRIVYKLYYYPIQVKRRKNRKPRPSRAKGPANELC